MNPFDIIILSHLYIDVLLNPLCTVGCSGDPIGHRQQFKFNAITSFIANQTSSLDLIALRTLTMQSKDTHCETLLCARESRNNGASLSLSSARAASSTTLQLRWGILTRAPFKSDQLCSASLGGLRCTVRHFIQTNNGREGKAKETNKERLSHSLHVIT